MSEFEVRTHVLMNNGARFRCLSNRINCLRFELSEVRSRLFGVSMLPVRAHLLVKNFELLSEARKLCCNGQTLSEIAVKYSNAENHILEFSGELANPAFDDDGQYGGRQQSPRENWREMAEIVRKYYPNASDWKVIKILKKLRKEGCGYVAMINTLFLRFKGREDEFESQFGFPMYVNGELNYDALVTDFYCAYDDPHSNGTRYDSREEMFEAYCRDHSIVVDVHNVQVTAESFNELRRNGEIVVGLGPVILYDADGKRVVNSGGGHAMTVTGVTDDGRLIVSSWGRTYYLDRDLSVYSDHCDFQQVRYR